MAPLLSRAGDAGPWATKVSGLQAAGRGGHVRAAREAGVDRLRSACVSPDVASWKSHVYADGLGSGCLGQREPGEARRTCGASVLRAVRVRACRARVGPAGCAPRTASRRELQTPGNSSVSPWGVRPNRCAPLMRAVRRAPVSWDIGGAWLSSDFSVTLKPLGQIKAIN